MYGFFYFSSSKSSSFLTPALCLKNFKESLTGRTHSRKIVKPHWFDQIPLGFPDSYSVRDVVNAAHCFGVLTANSFNKWNLRLLPDNGYNKIFQIQKALIKDIDTLTKLPLACRSMCSHNSRNLPLSAVLRNLTWTLALSDVPMLVGQNVKYPNFSWRTNSSRASSDWIPLQNEW